MSHSVATLTPAVTEPRRKRNDSRYALVHRLACMDGPVVRSGRVRNADDLLGRLVEWTDPQGRYFGEAVLVRRLLWWQDTSTETVDHWLAELVTRGDIRIEPIGWNCYDSGPQDILTIQRRQRFQRFSHRARISDEVRLAVYERDGWRCLHCGSADRLSLDHIHPWSRGGDDGPDNLQTLCRPCNSRKGARI